MTKAERIFNDTYNECFYVVTKFGYDEKTRQRLSNLITHDGEKLCTRTFNAIRKLIQDEREGIRYRENRNTISHEQAKQYRDTLNMVRNTLIHEIEIQKAINLCDFICD